MGFLANASGAAAAYDSIFGDYPVLVEAGSLSAGTTTWSSTRTYRLKGVVTVGNGATLTIAQGWWSNLILRTI